ncbi:RNase H domain-containing protein [Trichonephila clavipes]|nr:RNase H domain-containing protein [Trichonephila clavipes]
MISQIVAKTTPLRVKEDIEDVSRELDNGGYRLHFLDETSRTRLLSATLKEALSIPGSNSIWILSDSRSAIHHLSKWHKVGDNAGVDILEKLKRLSSFREIHLQWVPSHVNIAGNEIADSLAKDGAAQHTMNSAVLAYPELHCTYINSKQSTVPFAHHWYEAKQPGGSLLLRCTRQEQTILTRFRSGPLQTLTFRDRNKVFPTCVRSSACQASPEHILDWLGVSKQDLYVDNLMVLDFLRVNEIIDLI